tara:strand:+ start:101 stop:352 length:252 start_codon:yes stop_codon:yes gene_type:complete
MSDSTYKKMMFEDLEVNEELSKIGKSQHLGYLELQLKKYEDVVKKYIKSLDEEGEKKMAIQLMKLYKKHIIEFKIGLKKIYKG